MTEIKGQYKLYELSDRLSEIEECLELLEGVDIPHDLHEDYLGLLDELKQTEDDFTEKVDSILSLIQSRKRWLEIRKKESAHRRCAYGERLSQLIKRDQNTYCLLAGLRSRMVI